MNSVKVNVTREDIKRGLRFSPHYCPIARALKRKLGTINLTVNRDEFWFGKAFGTVRQDQLPLTAQRFIKEFDNRRKVHPFSFTVNVPRNWKAENRA